MNKQEVLKKLEQKKETILRSQKNLLMESELWGLYEARATTFMSAINIVEQLDEPKKVKVPAFVAEWFEKNSRKLEEAVYQLNVSIEHTDEQYWGDMFRWADNPENKPIETLIRMQDGYEVEEEPKWVVRVGERLLFKEFDDNEFPVFVIDDKPGSIQLAENFDIEKKAHKVQKEVGGTVEKV